MSSEPVFEDNATIYDQIGLETKEPKWDLVFFRRLPESHLQPFIEMINKKKYDAVPYFYFLRGVIHEYGILTKPDLALALLNYKRGAELNDSYSLLRLYFIQCSQTSRFGLEKSRDLEMLFLIKSAAYFDYYSDERFRFYPVYQLAVHLDKEDQSVEKCHRLLRRFERIEVQKLAAKQNLSPQEDLEAEKRRKTIEFQFLDSWLSIRFYLSKEEQRTAYRRVRAMAEEDRYLEASFLLSELCVGHIEGGEEYDLSKAEKSLLFCVENRMLKAFTALASLYEKTGDYQQAIGFYLKAARLGCYRGLYEYASFVICGFMTEIDFRKGIKYFVRGFWLGYMYSADHLVLILNNSEYQKRKIFTEQDYRMCFEISLHLYKNYNFISQSFLKYGPQYYLISICYEKGLNMDKPDYEQALRVLTEGEKDVDMKEKKYVLYRLGRIHYKRGNCEVARKYYETAFGKYMEIIHDEKLTKYPAQYYRVAKLLEHGWGVERNVNLALDFYRKGMKPSKYFFLLQHYYQNKCRQKYRTLKAQLQAGNFTLQRHSKFIHTVVLLGEGKIASAGEDSNIMVWDLEKRTVHRAFFKAHKGPIHHMAYSGGSGVLVSLGGDQRLRVWSIRNGRMVFEFDLKGFINLVSLPSLPSLGPVFRNRVVVQTTISKVAIFDIIGKRFLEDCFERVNLITCHLLLEGLMVWIGGDRSGSLNCVKFDREFKVQSSTKSVFHHKDVTGIIEFESFGKTFLVTSSYDCKICVILLVVKNNEVKLLLERKFTTSSAMDLRGLAYSPTVECFFVGNSVGKVIGFEQVLTESKGGSGKERKMNGGEPCVREVCRLEGHLFEISQVLVVGERFLVSLSAGRENFLRVWRLAGVRAEAPKGVLSNDNKG